MQGNIFIGSLAEFPTETFQARRKWDDIAKIEKKKPVNQEFIPGKAII